MISIDQHTDKEVVNDLPVYYNPEQIKDYTAI